MPEVNIDPTVLDVLIDSPISEPCREILPYNDSFPIIMLSIELPDISHDNEEVSVTYMPSLGDRTPILDLGVLESGDRRVLNLRIIEAGDRELKIKSVVSRECYFQFPEKPIELVPGIPAYFRREFICLDEPARSIKINDSIDIALDGWKKIFTIGLKWEVRPGLPIEFNSCFSTDTPCFIDFGSVPYWNEVEFFCPGQGAKEVQLDHVESVSVTLRDWKGDGNFSTYLSLPDGEYKYNFVLDGNYIVDPIKPSLNGEKYSILKHFPATRKYLIQNNGDENININFHQEGNWFITRFRIIEEEEQSWQQKPDSKKKELSEYNLEPGAKAELEISIPFLGRKEGNFEGFFTIDASISLSSNTKKSYACEKKVVLAIRASISRQGPEIELESDVVDFGEVYRGRKHEKTLKIRNKGLKPLYVFFQDRKYIIEKGIYEIPVILELDTYSGNETFSFIQSNSSLDSLLEITLRYKIWDYIIEPSSPVFAIEKSGIQTELPITIKRTDDKPVNLQFEWPGNLNLYLQIIKKEDKYFLDIKPGALSEFFAKTFEVVITIRDSESGEAFQQPVELIFPHSLLMVGTSFLAMCLPAPWRKDILQEREGYSLKGESQSSSTLRIYHKDNRYSDLEFKWEKEFEPYFEIIPLPDRSGEYVLEIDEEAWRKFSGPVEPKLQIVDKTTKELLSVTFRLNFSRAILSIPRNNLKGEVVQPGIQPEFSLEIKREDGGEVDLEFDFGTGFGEFLSLIPAEDGPDKHYLSVSSEVWCERPYNYNATVLVKDKLGGEEGTIHLALHFPRAILKVDTSPVIFIFPSLNTEITKTITIENEGKAQAVLSIKIESGIIPIETSTLLPEKIPVSPGEKVNWSITLTPSKEIIDKLPCDLGELIIEPEDPKISPFKIPIKGESTSRPIRSDIKKLLLVGALIMAIVFMIISGVLFSTKDKEPPVITPTESVSITPKPTITYEPKKPEPSPIIPEPNTQDPFKTYKPPITEFSVQLPPATNPPFSNRDILTLDDKQIFPGFHALKAGEHSLKIEKEGYAPERYSFTLPENLEEVKTKTIELKRYPQVFLYCDKIWEEGVCSILLNGRNTGKKVPTSVILPPLEHCNITVKRPRLLGKWSIDIPPMEWGKNASYEVPLAGNCSLTGENANAVYSVSIYGEDMDGGHMGYTPRLKLPAIAGRKYYVEYYDPVTGRKVYEEDFSLKPGEERSIGVGPSLASPSNQETEENGEKFTPIGQ